MLSNLFDSLRRVIQPTKKEQKPKKDKRKSLSYFNLFRYATKLDYFFIFLGTAFSILRAICVLLSIVSYSEIAGLLGDRIRMTGITSKTIFLPMFAGGKILINATKEENIAELRNDGWAFGIMTFLIAMLILFSGSLSVDLFNLVGLRITVKLRRIFFASAIRQDVAWHDLPDQQNFSVLMTDNMEKVREGISERLGHFIYHVSLLTLTVLMAFSYGWKLALAISCYIPIVLITNCFVAKNQSKLTLLEQDAYVNAGCLVDEIIGAIRTVVAFGGEKSAIERFDELHVPAQIAGKRKGIYVGIGDGVSKIMLLLSAAITFYYGSHLVLADRGRLDPEYSPAVFYVIVIVNLVGADQIPKAVAFIDDFAAARGSAVSIYEVIDTVTRMDPMSSEGKVSDYDVKGEIEFQDVFFRYPSREDAVVLRGLSLTIKAGETVALVGHTGCGKSTCLQLMQRFYDAAFGNILLDGLDIRKYNLSWLRSIVATVGQEPVLFQGTIGNNIKHGYPEATQKEVEAAARAAGAHDFITQLPEGYKTLLNENSVQLSGGQKQRIAIARALIQNPKILLLDEATSALDYNSEKIVQKALTDASKGRTTIVVSHRMSAIRDADRIVFIKNGKVAEDGTHEELMKLRGQYFDMVSAHESNNDNTNADDLKKAMSIEAINNQMNQLNRFDKLRYSNASIKLNNFDKDQDNTNELNVDRSQFCETFKKIFKNAGKERRYLAIATVCAALYGCTPPIYAVIFAELNAAMAETDENVVITCVTNITIACLVMGIVMGICGFLQAYYFNLAGLSLTTRLRSSTFNNIVHQEIGWFDSEENSIGALSSRLSGDTGSIRGAIGYPLSGVIQALANIICGIIIAFGLAWKLTLACLSVTLFMVISVIYEARHTNRSIVIEKRIVEETSRLATEALANIRTVAALRREPQLIHAYNEEVAKYEKQLYRRLRIRGFLNANPWCLLYIGYGVAMIYGTILYINEGLPIKNIIMVSESLLFGLMVFAMSLAYMPTFLTGIIAAKRLFQILERKPHIYSRDSISSSPLNENATEAISYRDISFRYPARPDVKVLNGFDLNIMRAKTVAMVGPSGCGKSTCIQLLLRYYDPNHGHIKVDGQDIQRDLSLKALRSRIGVVSQEPVLFERSIAENIAYGDNSRMVPMSEIIEAAKMANAHLFITALPNGYETRLGARGTQLSGGQKQRIAIARAIVRNPRFLLLDEATSALDNQSEKIVQSALDTACSGRTCIIIAHRLSTIQNADLICVLQNGRIAEHGNHLQLIAANGIYAELHRSQPDIK